MASFLPDRNRDENPKDKPAESWGSYALLLVFYACVVFLGTVFAITQTQKRIFDAEKTPAPLLRNIIGELTQMNKPSPEELEAIRESMNYWPLSEFPSIPQFEASRYTTTVENRLARIEIPAEDASDLTDYVDSLIRSGAKLLVQKSDFVALIQSGCEVHIAPAGASPYIELCGEPELSLKSQNLPPSLILPDSGRLVRVEFKEETSEYTFLYRNASISDALGYVNALIAADWQISGRIVQTDNTLRASYRKGGFELTVDYFTAGDYKVYFKRTDRIELH